MAYDPELHWSRIAHEIRRRNVQAFVSGDNNPYYRYKRQQCLRRFIQSIDFQSKSVLELGVGPGGNLLEAARGGAHRLVGIDISAEMLHLAAHVLRHHGVCAELLKTDGHSFSLPDLDIDLSFTVTVLQHLTSLSMFQRAIAEMCRMTRQLIVLVEDTGTDSGEPALHRSSFYRPVEAYQSECGKHGFELVSREYLGLGASRAVHALVSRVMVSRTRQEGEAYGAFPVAALTVLLPLVRPFDHMLPCRTDLTKMVFART